MYCSSRRGWRQKHINTHGHKLRFPPSKKTQFVTECGIDHYFSQKYYMSFLEMGLVVK